MKIPFSIGTDVFSVILLIFTMFLARKNPLVNSLKTKYYLRSSSIVCCILLFEIMDVLLENSGANFITLHMLVNVIAFAISPIVPICLIFLHNETLLKYKRYIYIPAIVLTVLSFSTWWTGLVFWIDGNNHYVRGPYFGIYPLLMLFYFMLMIWSDFENYKKYQKDEVFFLFSLYFIILLGTFIQLSNPKWLLIWTSISISLLLYYIFLRELQFKVDPLTEIYNRSVFQKDMLRIGKKQEYGIVVVDINNLKEINDQLGHATGDELIMRTAKVIQESVGQQERAYRIGGDEFCIICNNASEKALKEFIGRLDKAINLENASSTLSISVARGYCLYSPQMMKDIYEAFTMADQRMYSDKALRKLDKTNDKSL
jgi:diguanylate cyclase (GGDEF)-like protein